MTSAEGDVSEILDLVDKTEANLKKAEKYSGELVVPVLNEWRCGTRHIIAATQNPNASEAERTSALGHWRRAYFDSCDVLINFQLERLAEVHAACRNYPEAVATVLPKFWDYVQTMRRVQKMHEAAARKTAEEKEREYDSLSVPIQELAGIIEAIENGEADLSFAVAKARRNDEKKDSENRSNWWLAFVAAVAAVVTLALTIYSCFFKSAA